MTIASYIGCEMSKASHQIAVLTGDLVHSTALGPEGIEAAFGALDDIAHRLSDWHGAPVNLTRHRGDGWQMVLARPEMALRSALAIRAALRQIGPEYDSYIGIATGTIDHPVGPDLNTETSDVFITSGDRLEMAKVLEETRFSHADGSALSAATTLADQISQGWTPAQAQAILPFLIYDEPATYTSVASSLGKSRQAVTKATEAGALLPLILALDSIETAP